MTKNRTKKNRFVPTGLFKHCVNEEELADCFQELHAHFYGPKRGEMLSGDFCEEIDFVALLYVLVLDQRMNRAQMWVKPFHTFIKKRVMPKLKPSYKTLSNRLKIPFLSLKEQAECQTGIPKKRESARDEIERNYHAIREFFHRTFFYKAFSLYLA